MVTKPNVEVYPDMKHCYIIELKYARSSATATHIAHLHAEAIAQVNRYAATEMAQSYIAHTQLHKVVVLYQGMDMVIC